MKKILKILHKKKITHVTSTMHNSCFVATKLEIAQ